MHDDDGQAGSSAATVTLWALGGFVAAVAFAMGFLVGGVAGADDGDPRNDDVTKVVACPT